MRLAEIALGVGGGIGGWLVFISHALIVAVIPRADCDPASDELYVGTIAMAVLNAISALLLGSGLRFRDALRWFGVLALPLAAYGITLLVPMIVDTTFGAQPLCKMGETGLSATTLQRFWAPIQLASLLAASVQGIRYWLPTTTGRIA